MRAIAQINLKVQRKTNIRVIRDKYINDYETFLELSKINKSDNIK